MKFLPRISAIAALLLMLVLGGAAAQSTASVAYPVDRDAIARIREEGLKRSQLANTLSYMTDVIGARLTNSTAMDAAQRPA